MATIKFKNEHTGQYKEAPVGFSWTTFFFGFFPALFRGDWKNFMILFFLGVPTLGIIYIVYWFKYNKFYINDLVGNGFKAVMSKEEAEFMSAKIGVHLPVCGEGANPQRVSQPPQKNKLGLYIACGLGAAIVIGVITGQILRSGRSGESVPATPFSANASVTTSTAKQPPEPVNAKALVFVKNILIADIVLAMSGDAAGFPEFAPKEIPIRVTSLDLSKAYNANEFNADEKYKSRQVIVSGKVTAIRKDFSDDVIIDLPSSNPFMPVQAELASFAQKYAGMISKGDPVKLVCSVKGAIVGSVLMNKCQPLHWVAEEAADKQIKRLNNWLSRGGKSPFELNANTSRDLLAAYLLGATLAPGHVCLEQVDHQKCLSSIDFRKHFKDNEARLEADGIKWREWLQVPEVAPTPAV